MMRYLLTLGLVSGIVCSAGYVSASSTDKEEWHCEKKAADGKITDIEASSKDDCKKKGGKWKKGGADHHKEGDSHKHE